MVGQQRGRGGVGVGVRCAWLGRKITHNTHTATHMHGVGPACVPRSPLSEPHPGDWKRRAPRGGGVRVGHGEG